MELDDPITQEDHSITSNSENMTLQKGELVIRNAVLTAVFACACCALVAQETMSNDSIIKLVKAGLSEDLIVSTINNAPGKYDTSADGIIALKQAGASDKVVAALVTKSANAVLAPATPPPQPGQLSTAPEQNTPVSQDIGTSSGTRPVPAGARVVIAPMGGFETYFAAAVREKRVPITLTLEKASAQFFVVSTNTEWRGFVYGAGGGAAWNNSGGTAAYGASASSTRGLEASIMLIDARSKDVIWAYEVHKNSHGSLLFGTFGARGQQSVAEACAKHLKEYIEKGR